MSRWSNNRTILASTFFVKFYKKKKEKDFLVIMSDKYQMSTFVLKASVEEANH